MGFVERLGNVQRLLGREFEALVGLALERSQVKEALRLFFRTFGFLGDFGGRHALALPHQGVGPRLVKDALAARCGLGSIPGFLVVFLAYRISFRTGIKPRTDIGTSGHAEGASHLPVILGHKVPDSPLTLHHQRQRGCLHTTHAHQLVGAALPLIEPRHPTGAIDTHDPIGLTAAVSRISKTLKVSARAHVLPGITNGILGHRLEPHAAHGLAALRIVVDQPENQLTLTASVTGIDHFGD